MPVGPLLSTVALTTSGGRLVADVVLRDGAQVVGAIPASAARVPAAGVGRAGVRADRRSSCRRRRRCTAIVAPTATPVGVASRWRRSSSSSRNVARARDGRRPAPVLSTTRAVDGGGGARVAGRVDRDRAQVVRAVGDRRGVPRARERRRRRGVGAGACSTCCRRSACTRSASRPCPSSASAPVPLSVTEPRSGVPGLGDRGRARDRVVDLAGEAIVAEVVVHAGAVGGGRAQVVGAGRPGWPSCRRTARVERRAGRSSRRRCRAGPVLVERPRRRRSPRRRRWSRLSVTVPPSGRAGVR